MRLSRLAVAGLFCVAMTSPLAVALPARDGATGSDGKLMYAATVACRQLAERGAFCQPLSEARRQLGRNVGYYTLQLQVGPGEHDVISLHRVVAEKRPGKAKAATKGVFMIHGDLFGFEAAFLGLTLYAEPVQASLPTFLARNGVDVWGISYRWAQIPAGFPDTSFMADWGMDVTVADARIGLRIARVARWLSGQGDRRLHVLGWSRGVAAVMALANAEATEPPHRRDVGGLIPVDWTFKTDPENEAFRQAECNDVANWEALLAAGIPGVDYGFQGIGQLALDAPDDPSVYVPGFTNAQFAMGLASWPMGYPGEEWFHFAAGAFDENGIPEGFVYQQPRRLFFEFTRAYGFDPVRYIRDATVADCGEVDVPWDDHLAEVRVPFLYVGAGGGAGPLGEHMTRLVGSKDATALIVRKLPESQAALDIGHTDIFWAPASRPLFWEPILAWIRAH